jgi:hypothetical protein
MGIDTVTEDVIAANDAASFSYWDTAKLGEMIRLARLRLREAQSKFEQSGREERRLKKRLFETESAERFVRRAEDQVSIMRAELERRAANSSQS